MACTANQMIAQMQKFVGCKLGDKTHRDIVDTYNKYGKTKIGYYDAWCAATVSAAAIKCNATDIIPVDCYCPTQMATFKSKGYWLGVTKPQPGDIVYFDWDANAVPNHVGIVEKVSGNQVTSIEGNYSTTDSCQRRTFSYNWGYVVGYARPKYTKPTSTSTTKPTTNTTTINTNKKLQDAINRCKDRLHIKTYNYVTEDGIIGPKTTEAIKEIQRIHGLTVDGIAGPNTKSVLDQKYAPMTLPTATIKLGSYGTDAKRLQTALNIAKLIQGSKTTYARIDVDGDVGSNTVFAIKSFQKGNGLTADGIVGKNTYAALKKVLGCK